MLFILYINDLGKYLESSNISLYADDTALYVQGRSQVDIILDLHLELSMVCEWLKVNRLTLNVKKTKYMVFGSRTKLVHKPDLNITINGKNLERVEVMKYLGVFLDEHLTFSTHIAEICQKSSKKLGILRKSRELLDQSTSLLLYKSLVVPYIDYCNTVYMVANETDLKKLQLIQNTACRTVLRADKRTNIADMHASLNLLTLADRRTLHFKTECYKNVHDKNASLSRLFILECDIRVRQTRNTVALSMHVPDLRSILGRKLFSYQGPTSWNSTSKDLRQAESVHIFKSSLTKEMCRDVNHPG